MRPVASQLASPFVLLYTPPSVAAYTVVGAEESIASAETRPVATRPIAFQLIPPSVLLKTPPL
ncbi:MAG: hypothetical protein DMD78_28030, partial [Candidatus Rokuibacteriota bacterium]